MSPKQVRMENPGPRTALDGGEEGLQDKHHGVVRHDGHADDFGCRMARWRLDCETVIADDAVGCTILWSSMLKGKFSKFWLT